MCHHYLFLRAGWQVASREASIRRARLALIHGQDDAAALTLAGFSIGMDGHDRGTAFTAFEAALAISPSSARTYILGSVMFGWGGEAERAIVWSERGMRLSPFDPWAFAAVDAQAMSHLLRGRYTRPAKQPTNPCRPTPRTASPMCNWRRRWRSPGGCKTHGAPLPGFSNSTRHSASAASSREWTALLRLQTCWATRCALPGYRSS